MQAELLVLHTCLHQPAQQLWYVSTRTAALQLHSLQLLPGVIAILHKIDQ